MIGERRGDGIVKLSSEISCDVLVVGSGLAGCTAALEASRVGLRVILASAGPTFSGSSFFGGTWGLGCIAANDREDDADLVRSILDVGRGMADEELVGELVGGIRHRLHDLEERGVCLRTPEAAAEREYIPCFDRMHRLWRGLEHASLELVLARALDRFNISLLPHHLLIDLIEYAQGRVGEASGIPSQLAGAVLFDTRSSSFVAVSARAVVLATGGMGGLFRRRLCGSDCLGSAQAVALAHGEKLVNIEFLQLMPTIVTPRGPVVFNEKCFRFSDLSVDAADELLDQRSTYGPFTSRLPSREVDLAIARAESSVTVRVDRLPDPVPEFIGTYRSWYEDATGLCIEDPVVLFHSAHASNGGIVIGTNGSCALPGLFAAGECTGGMHGADRIGGLASANALVFGWKTGHYAAIHALGEVNVPVEVDIELAKASELEAVGSELGSVLDTHALVIRTEEGLTQAERAIADLASRLERTEPGSQKETAMTLLQRQRVLSARALISAMRARTESRGAHFRADHPVEDPTQARPNIVTLGACGSIRVEPAEHPEGSRMDNRSINP